jgi:hypothetical protein
MIIGSVMREGEAPAEPIATWEGEAPAEPIATWEGEAPAEPIAFGSAGASPSHI